MILIYEEKLEAVLKICLKRVVIAKVHAIGSDSKLIFLLTLIMPFFNKLDCILKMPICFSN